jgi:hypothetical protein
MGLQLLDGTLLAVGTELANSADCCCGGCAQFTPCDGGASILVLDSNLPAGLDIGEVVKISGECHTYDGPADCVGGESEASYGGDIYASCSECLLLCDASTFCANFSGSPSLTVVFAGLSYTGSGFYCAECGNFNGSYVVPYNTCSGTTNQQAAWTYNNIPNSCGSIGTAPRINVTISCNSPYTHHGINVNMDVGQPTSSSWQNYSGSTTVAVGTDFSAGISMSFGVGGLCGNSGTATIYL